MITVKNLYKSYGRGEVLKDISLTLENGKIYGLVGNNGSGKSTLIKCLCGIYPPDKGEVLMDEKKIYKDNGCKSAIGLLFDMPKYLQMYTVKAYAKYYAEYYPDFSLSKFKEYCEKYDVPMKANIGQISLGQAQKAQIAMVLSRNTDVILADEPENGLDNESREMLRSELRDLADAGKCILLSSHDLNNIERMCDEIIFIDSGVVKNKGLVDDILSKIQKVRIKTKENLPEGFVLSEDLENMYAVLFAGSREEAGTALSAVGITVIDFEKVTVSDAYTFMRKGGLKNE